MLTESVLEVDLDDKDGDPKSEGNIMKSPCSGSRQRACAISSPFLVVLVALTCLGLSSGVVMAQKTDTPEKEFEDFDRNNFDRSTNIDNEWLPLKPGTQFVYEGFTLKGGRRVPHRIVFTVTDLTKVIDGVRTVVCTDSDYSAGKLEEAELIFFAQDKDGNVWHLGQYRENHEDGEFAGGRAWLAGALEGARAGIMMKAKPRLGTPSYSQGYAPPPFNWTDRAKVYQMGQKTCVPFKCYEDVLVIAESSKEERNAQQLKYYARGVGNIRVGWRGKDERKQETLQLVKVVHLGPEALAKVRAEALELEKRASVYGRTPPAEHMPATR